MARRTQSNVPLPPGLKASEIKPASTGAAGYTQRQREQAREYLNAKRRESAAKRNAPAQQPSTPKNNLPPGVSAAQQAIISDPDFLVNNPEYAPTAQGVDVAGQVTGGRARQVDRPLQVYNIPFSNINRDIQRGTLMSATDSINQIGYLAYVSDSTGEPTGIIEERFLFPTPSGMGYSLLDRNQISTNILANLTSSEIKALKVDFYKKGLYSNTNAADLSLRSGALLDEDFRQVYQNVVRQTSLQNFSLASQGRSDLLAPEDFIGLISDTPQTGTTVETNIPGAEDADAVLRRQYQDYVGRAPSKKELDAFRASVTSVASRRPSTVTTTAGEATPGLGIGDVSQYRQEGFTGNTLTEMARETARTNPESAPYQKATKYFDTFLEALPAARGLEPSGVNLEELLSQGGVG